MVPPAHPSPESVSPATVPLVAQLTCPGGHARHWVRSVPLVPYPRLQAVQAVAARGEIVPAAHALHTVIAA